LNGGSNQAVILAENGPGASEPFYVAEVIAGQPTLAMVLADTLGTWRFQHAVQVAVVEPVADRAHPVHIDTARTSFVHELPAHRVRNSCSRVAIDECWHASLSGERIPGNSLLKQPEACSES
jgi:hypothetical protein